MWTVEFLDANRARKLPAARRPAAFGLSINTHCWKTTIVGRIASKPARR